MKRLLFGLALLLIPLQAAHAQTPEELREQRRKERQEERKEQKPATPAPARQAPPPAQQKHQPPAQQQRREPQQRPVERPQAVNPQQQRIQDRQVERQQQQQRRQETPAATTPASPSRRPDAAPRSRPEEPAAGPKRPQMDRPNTDRPQAARPRPERPTAERPNAERPRSERPRANRPPAAKPRADRPARDRANLPTRPDRANRGDAPGRAQARPQRQFDVDRSRQARQQARVHVQKQARRTYRFHGRNRVVVRAGRYAYAPGYRYRPYRRGDRFPSALLLASWFINDFTYYSLRPAPAGYRWVRYGPDAVMVNADSYEVYDTQFGVFDDGSAQASAPQDRTDLPAVDPDLPEDFLTGELELGENPDSCEDVLGQTDRAYAVDDAWRDEDWNGLARELIDAQCGSDLSWYLLGLAAEGLVLPEAAASYYQRALDLTDGDNNDFRCVAWDEDSCRGLDVAQEAVNGLERIYSPRE